MLREDVVQAIEEGKFAVHAVSTIDEALELLTGVPAGEADEEGRFPPDTINGMVQTRLEDIAARLRESQVPPKDAAAQQEFPEEAPPAQ